MTGENLQEMVALDHKNRQILQELEADGRLSNTALAERVGLSPSACLRRVQELERSGLIKGYKAILDRRRLGAEMTIYVLVGLAKHLKQDAIAFEQAMARVPEVRECHNITGSVEYLLRVEVSDLEAYRRFHSDILGIQPQVGHITSHIVLASAKDRPP